MNEDPSTGTGASRVGRGRPLHPVASFASYWLPVILWCLLIFGFSSDTQSTRRTSRIIGPLLRWLVPGVSDQAIGRVQFGARKCAHMAEYAVLALLAWRACMKPRRGEMPSWRWREAAWVFGFATVFAVSDEFHQSLVPNRQGHVVDVLIDALGATLGLLALRAWGRKRGWW